MLVSFGPSESLCVNVNLPHIFCAEPGKLMLPSSSELHFPAAQRRPVSQHRTQHAPSPPGDNISKLTRARPVVLSQISTCRHHTARAAAATANAPPSSPSSRHKQVLAVILLLPSTTHSSLAQISASRGRHHRDHELHDRTRLPFLEETLHRLDRENADLAPSRTSLRNLMPNERPSGRPTQARDHTGRGVMRGWIPCRRVLWRPVRLA